MMVIVFADLAGFTALTEAHGDAEAVEVVDAFERIVRAVSTAHGLRVVKNIGDAFMICGQDPAEAVEACLEIAEGVGELDNHPGVRIGVHAGEVVERGDDVFGTTVNIAARVAAEAASGQVLVTAAVLAGADLDTAALPVGAKRLRNLTEPVELFDVSTRAEDKEMDPVCRMMLLPRSATAALRHEGTTYHFCSAKCLQIFLADPESFATS